MYVMNNTPGDLYISYSYVPASKTPEIEDHCQMRQGSSQQATTHVHVPGAWGAKSTDSPIRGQYTLKIESVALVHVRKAATSCATGQPRAV